MLSQTELLQQIIYVANRALEDDYEDIIVEYPYKRIISQRIPRKNLVRDADIRACRDAAKNMLNQLV